MQSLGSISHYDLYNSRSSNTNTFLDTIDAGVRTIHTNQIGSSYSNEAAATTGWEIYESLITLDGNGDAADQVIYSPAAGKKVHFKWIEVSSDKEQAAGGMNYKIVIDEETAGTNFGTFNFNTQAQPVRLYPLEHGVTTTAAKDVLGTITSTSGADVLSFHILCLEF